MGLEEDDHCEPNSTPKLSLSKLPHCCKKREQLHVQTPPLGSSVSVPFHWEEAPGKPRATASSAATPQSDAAKCLDLPPRLASDDAKITVMSSPTTVLDGPYVGRSLSLACTFSFRKGREQRSCCGNFEGVKEEGKFSGGGSEISHSVGDIFTSDKRKIRKVKRRRSFFSLSAINHNLWRFEVLIDNHDKVREGDCRRTCTQALSRGYHGGVGRHEHRHVQCAVKLPLPFSNTLDHILTRF